MMKIKYTILCLVLSLCLLGCSKKPAAPSSLAGALPFQPVVLASPETEEIDGIKDQAQKLFDSKNFDQLDALAKKYRDSQESCPDGYWKLSYVYSGIVPQPGTPDSQWGACFATLREWIKAKPDSITARVTMANGLVKYAWEARGSDYADKVADESWKLFFQRLNEAVEVLNHAKPLTETCPYWWMELMQAELGLQADRSQYDATFHAAVQAWPNFPAFYFNRASFLLPRWYGADGEVEKDLDNSATQIGGEAGDVLYARVVCSVHGWAGSTNIFQEYGFSWPRVNQGLEAIEKRYPGSLGIENEAAHLAVLARDESAAKKYFDQTQGKIDMSVWSDTNNFIDFAKMVYGCSQ